MKIIDQISGRISEDANVINALESGKTETDSIANLFDDVKAANPNIYGFTLYNTSRVLYSSPNIAHLTSMGELGKNKLVTDFFASEQKNIWFLYPDKDYDSRQNLALIRDIEKLSNVDASTNLVSNGNYLFPYIEH